MSAQAMYKKIRDYEIEDILLPYESVRGLIHNFTQQESAENRRSKNKELTISLIANILINLIAVFVASGNRNRASSGLMPFARAISYVSRHLFIVS